MIIFPHDQLTKMIATFKLLSFRSIKILLPFTMNWKGSGHAKTTCIPCYPYRRETKEEEETSRS